MTIKKSSTAEDEFFAREDAEKKRKLAVEKARQMGEAERTRLKELHHGRCPACGMKLHAIVLRGIGAEKCYNCGGAFLSATALEQLAGEEGYWSRMLSFFASTDYGHRDASAP